MCVCVWGSIDILIFVELRLLLELEEALEKEVKSTACPFQTLNLLLPSIITHQVWPKEWDEAVIVSNTLH